MSFPLQHKNLLRSRRKRIAANAAAVPSALCRSSAIPPGLWIHTETGPSCYRPRSVRQRCDELFHEGELELLIQT